MNRFLRLMTALTLIAALLILALPAPANAQSRVTYTITEKDLNAYRLPANVRRLVSNVSIDLQTDQVVVKAKVVYSRLTLDTTSTWEPVISNGRLTWKVTSATVGGTTLNETQLKAIMNSTAKRAIEDAVKRYIDSRVRVRYTVESVSITNDELTVTVSFNP
jgi:D-alanyl-D-alanine carboxypeptidase